MHNKLLKPAELRVRHAISIKSHFLSPSPRLPSQACPLHVVWTTLPFLRAQQWPNLDRKSTRLNSSHLGISYAVFCLKKKKKKHRKIHIIKKNSTNHNSTLTQTAIHIQQ